MQYKYIACKAATTTNEYTLLCFPFFNFGHCLMQLRSYVSKFFYTETKNLSHRPIRWISSREVCYYFYLYYDDPLIYLKLLRNFKLPFRETFEQIVSYVAVSNVVFTYTSPYTFIYISRFSRINLLCN